MRAKFGSAIWGIDRSSNGALAAGHVRIIARSAAKGKRSTIQRPTDELLHHHVVDGQSIGAGLPEAARASGSPLLPIATARFGGDP